MAPCTRPVHVRRPLQRVAREATPSSTRRRPMADGCSLYAHPSIRETYDFARRLKSRAAETVSSVCVRTMETVSKGNAPTWTWPRYQTARSSAASWRLHGCCMPWLLHVLTQVPQQQPPRQTRVNWPREPVRAETKDQTAHFVPTRSSYVVFRHIARAMMPHVWHARCQGIWNRSSMPPSPVDAIGPPGDSHAALGVAAPTSHAPWAHPLAAPTLGSPWASLALPQHATLGLVVCLRSNCCAMRSRWRRSPTS